MSSSSFFADLLIISFCLLYQLLTLNWILELKNLGNENISALMETQSKLGWKARIASTEKLVEHKSKIRTMCGKISQLSYHFFFKSVYKARWESWWLKCKKRCWCVPRLDASINGVDTDTMIQELSSVTHSSNLIKSFPARSNPITVKLGWADKNCEYVSKSESD